MDDLAFHTLAAVALMCSHHFHGSWDMQMHPIEGHYDPGFEQCATVQKSLDDEKVRRAGAKAADDLKREKDRLTNALKAIKGEPFEFEEDPPEPKPQWTSCTMPTTAWRTR